MGWISEYAAEIALLIYILYPLFKRWWDRRKEARARKREQAEARAESRPARTERGAPPPKPAERQPPPPRVETPKAPSVQDFAGAARTKLEQLREQTVELLRRAETEPRLARLVPALREDLLGRLDEVERALSKNPTLSTVQQETSALRALEQLLRYLRTMAQQRAAGRSAFVSEADAIADACYAPLLEHARAQDLRLRTSKPVVVLGDWSLSIVPRFASTRVAPLRLPAGFEHSLWLWPAIAHEVAHDFYYSLEGLEDGLHRRLGLPSAVEVPAMSAVVDAAWLRGLFGAWLSESFADALGTVMLGPAYVETMRRAFRSPGSPQRTAAILQDGGFIDEHPPARLRVYMATRVLHHLGRHQEADALWEAWENEHENPGLYYLPLGGQWVGVSDEALHQIADPIVDALVQDASPALEGFSLLEVPGLAYLHAEHAEVERLAKALAAGNTADADVRWIVAAAVLAAAAQPALHDSILDAARRSIVVVGEPTVAPTAARRRSRRGIGAELVTSLKHRHAIRDAIILGAALTPHERPDWKRPVR